MHASAKHLSSSQNELLLTVFLKAVADSFVSIYIPIYLLTHGVGLRSVLLYCIVVYTITFVAVQSSLKLSQHLSTKWVLAIGIGMTAVFYALLHSLAPDKSYLLIALIDGAAVGFYYGAYDLLLTKAMKRSQESKAFTYQQIAGMLAGVIGPFIGSLIVSQWSFHDLFMVVIILLLITPLPLLFSKGSTSPHEPLKLGGVFKGSESLRRVDRAVFLMGVLYASASVWPLYLYIHYPNIITLGILTSISSGLVLFSTFVIGRSVDRHHRRAYSIGSLTYAPTWLTRLIFITPLGLTANAFIGSILSIAPTMAVTKDIYHHAKITENRTAHFSRVEFYMDAGRIVIFIIAYVSTSLTLMFIVSSLASVLFMTCRPKQPRLTIATAV